jgi:hypothetical protein
MASHSATELAIGFSHMTCLPALAARITKVALTTWFITWFILYPQIGYIITGPYIIAMAMLPSKVAR